MIDHAHSANCASVVNIKRGETYDVYIGRNAPHQPRNPLGNPYHIGIDGDRDEVVRKFAYDFPLRLRTEPEFRAAVLACQGKRMGCHCSPLRCHGNVLATFVNALDQGEEIALKMVAEEFLHPKLDITLSRP